MKVLVTTDGSERSLRVLPHASELARATGGRVILSRVLDPNADTKGVQAGTPEDAVNVVAERWREELRALLAKENVTSDVLIPVRAGNDGTDATIARALEESGADVVAMDTRGTGALRHAILGSVTMGLLGKTDHPVMVTGGKTLDNPRPGTYRLLATSDGSAAAASMVPFLQKFSQMENVHITLAQVYVPSLGDRGTRAEMARARQGLERLRTQLPRQDNVTLLVKDIPELGGVDSAIIATARDEESDAVVMSTHGHSRRRHLVAGSVALGVVAHAPIPVILVRDPGH